MCETQVLSVFSRFFFEVMVIIVRSMNIQERRMERELEFLVKMIVMRLQRLLIRVLVQVRCMIFWWRQKEWERMLELQKGSRLMRKGIGKIIQIVFIKMIVFVLQIILLVRMVLYLRGFQIVIIRLKVMVISTLDLMVEKVWMKYI